MAASVGGSLLAVTQQTVDPNNFSFNNSLELLLLVVVGGRSLVSGALVAGLLQLVNLLPTVPASVHRYLPLGVALTVIAIAQGSDGLLQNVADQARYCLAVLYRLPRPQPAEPEAAGPVPSPATAVTREQPMLSPSAYQDAMRHA